MLSGFLCATVDIREPCVCAHPSLGQTSRALAASVDFINANSQEFTLSASLFHCSLSSIHLAWDRLAIRVGGRRLTQSHQPQGGKKGGAF